MSVTTPAGFTATGVVAGLKSSGRPDLALIVNQGPLQVASGVFTSNRVVAAPVVWSRQVIATGQAHAVVLNSGGANACTGADGYQDTVLTAERVAHAIGGTPEQILVCSTGLIGERLPLDRLLPGVDAAALALSTTGGPAAATAIMTTDSVEKQTKVIGEGWSVGGMAKGAGMLAPGLATMLVVLTTDAVVTPALAQTVLQDATACTFDRIDSDGCMSTNDTVLLLSSGASGISPSPAELGAAVEQACAELARGLIADAEGASHDIAVTVVGAENETAAVTVAKAVTRSNLFKAAVFGNDPNWGRVLAAVGTVPVEEAAFRADQIDVSINGVQVCRAGAVGEPRGLVNMAAAREVAVLIDLHAGEAQATVWTNDLTHDYVHENSAYST